MHRLMPDAAGTSNPTIDDLLARMRDLESEIQEEHARNRGKVAFVVDNNRARFALDVLTHHRLHRVGVWQYLRESRWLVALTAPVAYLGFVPFALLDLFVTLYAHTCFRVYGIHAVRRADYLVFDRSDLSYLNVIERFNCFYCSYGNGVAAYFREVAARTEQYWCPIKHARRMIAAHERYPKFFEFGDAQAYRAGLDRLRETLKDGEAGKAASR